MVPDGEAVESALGAERRNLVAFLVGYQRGTDGTGYYEGLVLLVKWWSRI